MKKKIKPLINAGLLNFEEPSKHQKYMEIDTNGNVKKEEISSLFLDITIPLSHAKQHNRSLTKQMIVRINLLISNQKLSRFHLNIMNSELIVLIQ